MRTWQVQRRKRTRHLIELGGLVVKAGLVNLIGDDRATMLGALLWIADKLQSDQGERARALWSAKGSKRSRQTRRHTRGQIDPIQQLVVEPRQWYVNYAKTDGCKRALNWRPTLPLQRRHKCGQRRRVTAPVIRMRASAANSIWIVPLVPEGAVNGCRSGAMETAAKRTPSSCRCTGSDPQARTPARRTGLCLIRLDKPAFPSQTAPREQLARGQPVSPRRYRHKPGPAIALRHDPVLLFQRPTAPGARRDNVKPRVFGIGVCPVIRLYLHRHSISGKAAFAGRI